MKFKVNSQDLVNMLKVATKGYDRGDDSSFVCMEIEENEMKVVSRRATSYFSGSVAISNLEMDEDEPHVHYIDGEVLKKLSGIFPAAPIPIEFSVNKSSRGFTAKYTGNKFILPIVSDTTPVKRPATNNLGLIQGHEFMDTLNSLLKIVDSDETSQEHPSSCLHLTFNSEQVQSMATDRYAIAELTKPFDGDAEYFAKEEDAVFLIKHSQAMLLSKAITPAEVLTLVASNEYFGYIDGDGNMSLVARTSMDPLNYASLKAIAGADHNIVLEVSDLRNALSTISKLSFEKSFEKNSVIMNLNAEDKSCTVSSVTGDIISVGVESMDIDEDLTINFIRTVLQEALIPVNTNLVRLEWPDNKAIYSFVPTSDNGDEEGVFIGAMPYDN